MAVETADYLAGLDPDAPTRAAPKAEGDDHLRAIKKALRQSFPGFTGAVFMGGTDTGVTNAYVLTPATPLVSYSPLMAVLWLPANTNGGASTLNVSGLGAVPIRRVDGAALGNGDIVAGQPVAMVYTGSQFRMIAMTPQQITQIAFGAVLPGQTGNAGKFLKTDGVTASWSNSFGVAVDEAKGADIPAAATINLTAPGVGNFMHVYGTGVSITSIIVPSGAERTIMFDGAGLTLVHSANLLLPGLANIVTQVGDRMVVRGNDGVTVCIAYHRADGRAVVQQTPPGIVLLAEVTPTNVAAIDFLNVFSSTYDDYLVQFSGVSVVRVPCGFTSVTFQVAKNGVVDTLNNYRSALSNGTDATATASITVTEAIGSVDHALYLDITLTNANSTINQAIKANSFTSVLSGTARARAILGAHFNNGDGVPLSGFRLGLSGSVGATFGTTGKIRLYGYRKA